MSDELTTRLTRQLREQVDDWSSAPLTLEGVQGRARGIRRTRRVLTGAVAAAVAAIAVPTVMLLTPDVRGGQEIPPVAPTPSETVAPVDPSPIGVPFVEGGVLTLPDGAQEELPAAPSGEQYVGGAVLGERVVLIRQDLENGGQFLDRLDAALQVSSSVPLSSGIAHNHYDSAITYLSEGRLVVESMTGETVELGSYGRIQPIRLVGGPDCVEPGSCAVWYDDGQGQVGVATNGGPAVEVPGDPIRVTDVAEDGRVAMVISVDLTAGGACSALVTGNGDEVLETCNHTLQRFSPGGGHLSAAPAYRSGIGDVFVAIVDARSGDEVARFEPGRGGFVRSSTWEDAEHLLVTTYSYEQGWSVVRLGVDGSQEVALGPDDSTDDMAPAYVVLGAS